jgi:hypothetical protein
MYYLIMCIYNGGIELLCDVSFLCCNSFHVRPQVAVLPSELCHLKEREYNSLL